MTYPVRLLPERCKDCKIYIESIDVWKCDECRTRLPHMKHFQDWFEQ